MTADPKPAPAIHLQTHSYFSFLAGMLAPGALVEAAVANGMDALALTDLHGLTGAIEFYQACREAEIKPILGLELVVKHRSGTGNLVFLAMDMRGWQSLCRLSSHVQTQAHRDPTQGLAFETLEAESTGLICLTGGSHGLLHHLCQERGFGSARRCLEYLKSVFGDRLYVQIVRPAATEFDEHKLLDLTRELEIPLVAAYPVYYGHPEQAELQRTLTAMRLNCRLADLPPNATAPPDSHFVPSDEMAARYEDLPEALQNTRRIAERCCLELPLDVPHFPEVRTPDGETPGQRLRKLAEAGAKERYGRLTPEIKARLNHEMTVIADRQYAPLFLIVQEILEYARQTGVPISSRGSAASSLVAHCLGITTPDPLALDLYFERFLNPARKTPPDIDTDLCSRRRDAVLQYVYNRYGADRVAMVATINRFRPRSTLREVAKTHGLVTREINALVDKLPYRGWGPPFGRGETDDPFGVLKSQFTAANYKAIFRDAAQILGFPRHLSVHPGGIVISPTPMTDLVPTHLASKGMVITQFDLEAIERMGLVKIDLLGTRGLTVIGDVAEKVQTWRSTEYATALDVLEDIPENDPETADIVRNAQTIGCFQIESPGMRATLREIDASSPEDIMIALALYRPGPMTGGLKDAFVRRHLGQERVEHIHPALRSLLADTYGVILYQEQVLLIASQLAGLSLTEADLLRRAMSHFDPGERMKTLKRRFVQGAKKLHQVPAKTGEQIWDLMAAFAGYGFPKAHAASYAEVSWRSAWCKTHYPAEFMAAVLAGWGGYYRQPVYLNEARRLGLPLRAPHINRARRQFSVAYPQGLPTLYMGLDQVKELTRRTQNRIIAGRPFRSMDDFLTRVDPRPKEAENLVVIGALEGLGRIPDLLARLKIGGWAFGQLPLFAPQGNSEDPDWTMAQRVEAQVRVLGTSVETHPLERYADRVADVGGVSTAQAILKIEEEITVVGLRQTTQRFFAHEGEPFYILELEDLEGVLPVRMKPDFYRRHRPILSSRKPIIVEGEMIRSETTGEPEMVATSILRL